MAYQTVTKTSYGSRVKNSFKGIGSGIMMIIIATVLLFWNEGRAVKMTKALKETEKVTVEMPDINIVDPQFEGKVVHANGTSTTECILKDDAYGVSENAVKLNRTVEYYQWVEHQEQETKDKIGGGQETVTTYTYEKKWVSRPENSSKFADPEYKSSNHILVEVANANQIADVVTFGAYTLPSFAVGAISGGIPAAVNMSEETIGQWNESLNAARKHYSNNKDDLNMVTVDGNTIYFGVNPSTPSIGDMRITFTKVNPVNDISLIAQVSGNTFTEYVAKNGKSISAVSMGIVSAEDMFAQKHSANKTITWIIRILGILLCIGGFKSIFGMIDTLLKVLPFLSKIASVGTTLISWVLGLVWSLVVIALGWIVYRPILGIALLAAAAALIIFLSKKAKDTSDSEPLTEVQ